MTWERVHTPSPALGREDGRVSTGVGAVVAVLDDEIESNTRCTSALR
jgi:hypothetical protein